MLRLTDIPKTPAIRARARSASARPTDASIDRRRSVHRLCRQSSTRSPALGVWWKPLVGAMDPGGPASATRTGRASRSTTGLGPCRLVHHAHRQHRHCPRSTGTAAPPAGAPSLPRPRTVSHSRSPLVNFGQLPEGPHDGQPSLTVAMSRNLSQNSFSWTRPGGRGRGSCRVTGSALRHNDLGTGSGHLLMSAPVSAAGPSRVVCRGFRVGGSARCCSGCGS